MLSSIEILPIKSNEYYDLSIMVGELLNEIMLGISVKAFNFNREETETRVKDLISRNKYWVFVAKETNTNAIVGFVSLYESYALYTEGAYGTIPELYVRANWRSKLVGQKLLETINTFAKNKGWHRIEVTTPPLPEFDKTLAFYQDNSYEITGGRKLKLDINT